MTARVSIKYLNQRKHQYIPHVKVNSVNQIVTMHTFILNYHQHSFSVRQKLTYHRCKLGQQTILIIQQTKVKLNINRLNQSGS